MDLEHAEKDGWTYLDIEIIVMLEKGPRCTTSNLPSHMRILVQTHTFGSAGRARDGVVMGRHVAECAQQVKANKDETKAVEVWTKLALLSKLSNCSQSCGWS
jgi:ABC-type cobalamin/Fe3+-siderophores transport system ATPase subunit